MNAASLSNSIISLERCMEIENSSTILYNVYRHIFRAVIDTWFEDILQKADGSGSILMEGGTPGTTSLEDVVERGEGWRGGSYLVILIRQVHARFFPNYWILIMFLPYLRHCVTSLSNTYTHTHLSVVYSQWVRIVQDMMINCKN